MVKNLFLASALLLPLTALSQPAAVHGSEPTAPAAPANTNQQMFQVNGVVQELNSDGKTVVIKHDAIPNYMEGMTMPFEVKDPAELKGLKAGDNVTFRLIVTEKAGWIDHVSKLILPGAAGPVDHPAIRVLRNVEPLKVGDVLPEYHFTNELGQAVSLSQFKGQAFAFTFFFTRCPFPNFCPYLSNNFEETQQKLLALSGGPTNWHLFSISFDTERDSPETLKAYAARYKYQPEHWSFLTGDPAEVTAIGDQVGEYFDRDATGSINHNMRTVVVDAQGKIQSIVIGNTWTSDELVEGIKKAAATKP